MQTQRLVPDMTLIERQLLRKNCNANMLKYSLKKLNSGVPVNGLRFVSSLFRMYLQHGIRESGVLPFDSDLTYDQFNSLFHNLPYRFERQTPEGPQVHVGLITSQIMDGLSRGFVTVLSLCTPEATLENRLPNGCYLKQSDWAIMYEAVATDENDRHYPTLQFIANLAPDAMFDETMLKFVCENKLLASLVNFAESDLTGNFKNFRFSSGSTIIGVYMELALVEYNGLARDIYTLIDNGFAYDQKDVAAVGRWLNAVSRNGARSDVVGGVRKVLMYMHDGREY